MHKKLGKLAATLFAILLLPSSVFTQDGQFPAPRVDVSTGKVEWTLDDDSAKIAYDYFKSSPTCNGNGGKKATRNRRRAPNDVTEEVLTSEILRMFQQSNTGENALVPRLSQVTDLVVASGQDVPELLDEAETQAMVNAVVLVFRREQTELDFFGIVKAQFFAMLLLSVVRQCFHYTLSPDTFKHIELKTMNEKMDWTHTCPVDDYAYMCENDWCQGTSQKCTSSFLKGCKCLETKNCPTPDIRPYCDSCGGADEITGLCKGDTGSTGKPNTYKGCVCNTDVEPTWHVPYDGQEWDDIQDIAQKILDGDNSDNGNGHPHCNGLDSNTWRRQGDFSTAVAQYCGTEGKLHGKPGTKDSAKFFDTVELTIEWPQKSDGGDWEISLDDCGKNLMLPVDSCDGNDALHNPSDLKHGGYYKDKNGIKYSAQPLKSDEFQKICSGWGGTSFMEAGIMNDDIRKMCQAVSLLSRNREGGTFWSRYGAKTNDEVEIRVTWIKGLHLTLDTCVDQMSEISVGCDGDPVLNQFDFKWGGEKLGRSVYYNIHPTGPRRPLVSGDNHGALNDQETRYGDTGRSGKKIDKAVLQMCLSGYNDQWSDLDCAGMVTFKRSVIGTWTDAKACQNGCVNALSDIIEKGAKVAECATCGGLDCCYQSFGYV